MDDLEARGLATRFLVVGLCTGSDNALRTAGVDDRVIGCVLIDGQAFETRRSRRRAQIKKLLQPWRWRRYISRRLGQPEGSRPSVYEELAFQPLEFSSADYKALIGGLIDRGGRAKLVFTGHGPRNYNYVEQFYDTFPTLRVHSLSVDYYPDSTHTFTRPDHRQALVESVVSWVTNSDWAPIKSTRRPTR